MNEERVLQKTSVAQSVFAEGIGTAFLLATVVGSGIMGERLANGNMAIALLANSLATGAILTVLILLFAPLSGAHFNPAVTLVKVFRKELSWKILPYYLIAQISGAFIGVYLAHLMFEEPLFMISQHVRQGGSQLLSEFIATFGLLAVIWGCSRRRDEVIAFAVGAYITGAYWFTASTSFANPAVTLARSVTNTFSGIRPVDAPLFILAQLCGAITATVLFAWLTPITFKTKKYSNYSKQEGEK